MLQLRNGSSTLILVGMAALTLAAGPVQAQTTLWYNGDFDGRNGLANERNTAVSQANVYDNFIVPTGETWAVTQLFSNDLSSTTATQAEWEIRTGVSLGNGGTLLASGTGAATITPTGRSGFGLTEFTYLVDIPTLTLTPGTYWLTVAPVDSGSGRSFDSTTSGANAIGMPQGNDDNSFFNSSFFGGNFASPSTELGPGTWDFSMGVRGTLGGDAVPEPSSIGLLAGLGATGSLFALRRLRRRK